MNNTSESELISRVQNTFFVSFNGVLSFSRVFLGTNVVEQKLLGDVG